MGSYNTTLTLVNFSGKKITETAVTIDHAADWDYLPGDSARSQPFRPDLNFTGPLDDNDGRSMREEINTASTRGCWFSLRLTFDDGSTMSFRANQWDASLAQQRGRYTESLSNADNPHLEVFRITGEDFYTYTQAFYIRPSAKPDNSGWMAALLRRDTTLRLNEITMPGSHDAGMYLPGDEKYVTQSLTILDQLKAGSRYFDLRIYKATAGLCTYHLTVDGGMLDAILDDVRTFRASNPGETIFLKFRSYKEADRADTVALVKSKLAGLLYTTPAGNPNFATMKMQDLAGTVVAAFTSVYSGLDPREGTFPYVDFGNEDTGDFYQGSNENSLGVYDAYNNDVIFATMEQDQQDKRARFGGLPRPYLFLFSWTLTGKPPRNYGRALYDIDLLSAAANPRLPAVLYRIGREKPPRHIPNIAYIDQIDPWLCSSIISTNPEMRGSVGDLLRVEHAGWQTGARLPASPPAGLALGQRGWLGFRSVFATTNGCIYTIGWNGDLSRHTLFYPRSGAQPYLTDALVVDQGQWDAYKSVFASSGGLIYAIDTRGQLWRCSDPSWSGRGSAPITQRTKVAGSGWAAFTSVFATGNGVIYAIDATGQMYRARDAMDGSPLTSTKIGPGWAKYTSVFATSDGVVYGILPNGDLIWFRDAAWASGSGKMPNGKKVGSGWDDFRTVFASSEGGIYGITK